MNYFNYLNDIINKSIEKLMSAGTLPQGLDLGALSVEPPRDPSHGDVATNAALVLAKSAGMKPREIAEPLAECLAGVPELEEVSIAGPGFINIRLAERFLHERLLDVLKAGTSYGDSDLGSGIPVNVEYV